VKKSEVTAVPSQTSRQAIFTSGQLKISEGTGDYGEREDKVQRFERRAGAGREVR
jgi:hypothetical protein